MTGKNKPVEVASMLTTEDIQAWYEANPLPPSKAEGTFPIIGSENTYWKTMQNRSLKKNIAADPISPNSTVPVSGRKGFKDVMGEMATFGKGREMTADEIEKFERLKRNFAQLQNATAARELLDYYGDDLGFVRDAMYAEMTYLDWTLISSACEIGFVAANSPYMQGITGMDYGLEAWQKDAVGTSWDNPAAEILGDIESAIDLGDEYSKVYTTIFINKKWWTYVRNNTQIQKYTASLAANLFDTQAPPTLDAVNAMLAQYFSGPIAFEVIDERVTRVDLDGNEVTSNPFANGVAVFAQSKVLGHFQWNALPIIDPRETTESWFTVGNITKVDPSYSKIYAKGRGFPVIDTYHENFYLKVDAVAW